MHPAYRICNFLNECHENIMKIIGHLFEAIGSKLYHLSTEQLTMIIHQGCCAGFDHLPVLKLNTLLRILYL